MTDACHICGREHVTEEERLTAVLADERSERAAMVEEAVDEQTRSIKAALMDEVHDHALDCDLLRIAHADREWLLRKADAAEAELVVYRETILGLEAKLAEAQELAAAYKERAVKLEAENARLRAALNRAINSSRQYAQVDRKERNYAFHMLMLRECEDVLHGRAPEHSSIVPAWGVTSISAPRLSTEAEAKAIMGQGESLVRLREIEP